ncbi:MAG TPA: TetR/AcrR family transcriptional regulator [Acidimicrobiales bacterium]
MATKENTADQRPSAPRTARDRARVEITTEILDAARRHLASEGAPSLSLRAIARELGMTSSAIYRYVASRDDLLTWLIVDAYNSLGEFAEGAETNVGREDLFGRFRVTCVAVRQWAIANPHEWALIYGSPVPGYVAPADTVGPATRVPLLLAAILVDAVHAQRVRDQFTSEPPDRTLESALAPLREALLVDVPTVVIQRALKVWVGVFGVVSFEIFGQFQNVVGEGPGERDAFYARCVHDWANELAIA